MTMKNSDFYAQDSIMVSAAIKSLDAFAAAQPELQWGALVDSAFDYPASEDLPYVSGSINCYLMPGLSGLQKAAPRLVPIDIRGDKSHLRAVLQHCQARPMISILGSRIPLAALSDYWQPIYKVAVADHQGMLLRFGDTRVLSVLPGILLPAQWFSIAAPLAHWLVLDREGRFAPLPIASGETGSDRSIKLSQQQIDSLLSASQPDAIIDLLRTEMADIIPVDIRNSALHELVRDSCQLAAAHEIDTFSDTFSLAVAACLTQGVSTRNPMVADLLRSKNWSPGDLGMKMLSEGLV